MILSGKTDLVRRQVEHISRLVEHYGHTGQKKSLIEIGCGEGEFLLALEKDFQVTAGVDINQEALEITRKLVSDRTELFLAADWPQNPYPAPKDAYDVAVTLSLFHHLCLENLTKAMVDIARLIKSGGLFVGLEYNPLNPAARLAIHLDGRSEPTRPVWPSEMIRAAREAHFSILKTGYTLFFPFSIRPLVKAEKHLAHLPLGGKFFFVAKKA